MTIEHYFTHILAFYFSQKLFKTKFLFEIQKAACIYSYCENKIIFVNL